MEPSGYSGTPLIKKLGIKDGHTVVIVNNPSHYFELLEPLPHIRILRDELPESADFIHLFAVTWKEFMNHSLRLKPLLKRNGMLWVSWPKASSGITSDLNRDSIRVFLLDNGLVDVKVCAIDAVWSGLKFMYRIKDRTKTF